MMSIMKKNKIKLIAIVLSLIGVYNAPLMIQSEYILDYSNSIWPLLYFVVFYFAFSKLLLIDYSGKLLFSTVFAFIISCFLVIGQAATKNQSISTLGLVSILDIVFLTILISTTVAYSYIALDKFNLKLTENKASNIETFLQTKKFFIITMGIILLFWTPMFLANFPGTAHGDITMQIEAYLSGDYLGMFPLMHTLFVGWILTFFENLFGSKIISHAIYTVVQMVIIAFVIAYIVKFFVRLKSSRLSIAVVVLYFCLHPVVLLYSKDIVRDVLFSYFVLLFFVLMTELVLDIELFLKSKIKMIMFVFVAFVSTGMRNLGFAVVALTILIVYLYILVKRRKHIKKLAAIFVVTILLCGIWNGPIVDRVTYDRVDNIESMSVPINQLVRVRHLPLTEITEQQQQEIDNLFMQPSPFYDVDNVDWNKFLFNDTKYNENSVEFWKIWFKYLLEYPIVYIDALAQLNTQTWYPDSILDGYNTLPYAPYSHIETTYYSYTNHYSGIESKFEWLFDLQVYISENISFSKIPLVSLLFSPAMMLYILMYCLFYLIYKKAYNLLLVPMVVILMHVATFFGPVVVLRYNLISFIAVPIAVAFILSIDRIKQLNETNI